jgi:hypothetical protein
MRFLEKRFKMKVVIVNMNTYATAEHVQAHIQDRNYFGLDRKRMFSSHGGRILARFIPRIDDLEDYVEKNIKKLGLQREELNRKAESGILTSEDDGRLRKIEKAIQGLRGNLARWKKWIRDREGDIYEADNWEDGYTPCGHGDVVMAMILDADGCCRPLLELLKQGKDILQAANVDNLTGVPDAGLLRQFRQASTSADDFVEMQCEVAMKYPGDVGGAMAAMALVSLDGGKNWEVKLVEEFCFPIEFKHSDCESKDYIAEFNTATYLVNAVSLLRLFDIITDKQYTQYKQAFIEVNKDPKDTEAKGKLQRIIEQFAEKYEKMSNEALRQKQTTFIRSQRLPLYTVFKTVHDRKANMAVPIVQMESLFGDLTSLLRTQFVKTDRVRRFHPIKEQAAILRAWRVIRGFIEKLLHFDEVALDKEESLEKLGKLKTKHAGAIDFGNRPGVEAKTLPEAIKLVRQGRALVARKELPGGKDKYYLRLLYDQHNLLDNTGLPVESTSDGHLLFDPELPELEGQQNFNGQLYSYEGVCLDINRREIGRAQFRFDMLGLAHPRKAEITFTSPLQYSGNYPAYIQVSKGEVAVLLELAKPSD